MTIDVANVVLVHGAWHGGWSWGELPQQLRQRGATVTVVDSLPSTTGDPSLGLTADADFLRNVVSEQDRPVTLVGHSYGGMVLSELAGDDSIAAAVYVAGFLPQKGQTILDLVGGTLPEWIEVQDDGAFCVVASSRARELMASGLASPADAEEHVRRMVPHAVAAFGTPSSTEGWGDTPVSYLLTRDDLVIPADLQRAMADHAGARIEEIGATHIPMHEAPAKVVDFIAASAR